MTTSYDPSGIGVNNGNFAGLPHTVENAYLILLGVPWEVTVSYGGGTAQGPQAMLDASRQLDLYDRDNPQGWQRGIWMPEISTEILQTNQRLRELADAIIGQLEAQGAIAHQSPEAEMLAQINQESELLNQWVLTQSQTYLNQGKRVGVVGGDHSVPLGYLQALATQEADFGILQIDAHADLREGYEGFTYSHASIMFNALQIPQVSRLVQVGIRDLCQDEVERIQQSAGRIVTYYDADLKEKLYSGQTWLNLCQQIVAQLPPKVYISFDVDGLDPKLCPQTGTPVPGGLELEQVFCLFREVVKSDRQIIGFDVSEIGNGEWDGNVAARIIYKLFNLMG